MTAATHPDWVRPLLTPRASGRDRAARRLLAQERAWPELRQALLRLVLADPIGARPAVVALRAAAQERRDPATTARLRALEGRTIHRTGRLDEALAVYREAERGLQRAGLAPEARAVAVARVDALATSGRVDAALRLADRLARELPAVPPSALAASLSVNRGNALRLRGDLEAAVEAYEGAARVLTALGNPRDAAVARLNAAVARVEGGDAEGALAPCEEAVAVFRAAGAADLEREARYDLAWARVHAGHLGSGIRALDALASEHRGAGLARREALCRMDLADAIRRAGDAAGAEPEALRAAAAFEVAGARAERAEALWFAAASAGPLAPTRALAHARAARAAARAAGRPAVLLRCDVLLADLAARTGRPPTLARCEELSRRARAMRVPSLEADVDLLFAETALAGGRVAQARRRFTRALRRGASRPWVRVAAETGLARVEARTPRGRSAALARLRRIAAFLDRVRSDLPGAWLRAAFVAEQLDPYLARIDLLLARGRPKDRREAASLLDVLATRRFLGARPPAADPRLARARARLEALYDQLARGEGPTRGGAVALAPPEVLERRARAWERAVVHAWRRRERSQGGPAGDETATPPVVSVEADTAVLHVWRREGRARALLRTASTTGSGCDLGPIEDLAGLVESLRLRARRWSLLRGRRTPAADPAEFDRILADLAHRVLTPLAPATWPRDVALVLDPSLPDVPWEILPVGGSPSAPLSALRRLLRVPSVALPAGCPTRGEGTVVVGVGEPGLPGVAREVEAVAAAASARHVLTGPAATRAAVADALSTSRVVHVAGHGWDAREAPPLGGIRVADGWFSAEDLPPGGVAAHLVVLAACRTGRAEEGPPGRAWGGLVSALLAAGVARVVWTADDVNDAVTERLITRFHRLRSSRDDRDAFGAALRGVATEEGHAGSVLPFRLSGVLA